MSVTDKLQYIVMEYIDGITLKEYMPAGRPPYLGRGGALPSRSWMHWITRKRGGAPGHQAPEHHAGGGRPVKIMDFGIARFSAES